MLTSWAPTATPAGAYDTRQGAKLTPVLDRAIPVMALTMVAAPLANLTGVPIDLGLTTMLYFSSLVFRAARNAASSSDLSC
jgi:hypothetical protein